MSILDMARKPPYSHQPMLELECSICDELGHTKLVN